MLETYSISVDKFFVLGSLDRWLPKLKDVNKRYFQKDASIRKHTLIAYTVTEEKQFLIDLQTSLIPIPPPKRKTLFPLFSPLPSPASPNQLQNQEEPIAFLAGITWRDGFSYLEDSDFPKTEKWKIGKCLPCSFSPGE